MKASNLLKTLKSSTFISKQLRPKDFNTNHPSNLISETIYKGQNEEFKISDLGYLQRSLNQPKSVNSNENQIGFHESNSN